MPYVCIDSPVCTSPNSKNLPNSDVIDLHGTIVVEAIAISQQYLEDHWTDGARRPPQTLTRRLTTGLAGKVVRIITGRGNHSRNGVAVLRPAVKNALTSDGWIVDTCDGGLVVRGMRN